MGRGRILKGIIAELGKTDFKQVLDLQRRLNRARSEHSIPDILIFNEHEPVYTVGLHKNPGEVVDPSIKPVQIERGGSVTYHGPGQLVVYFILSLMDRKTNIKVVIETVQAALVELLNGYGITAEGRLDKETGVWVSNRKICSIGFAIRESSTLHGIALNVSTDLDAFGKILPCGFSSSIMTSIQAETGKNIQVDEVQKKLKELIVRKLEIDVVSEIENIGSLEGLI